jgi:hypothetical protein
LQALSPEPTNRGGVDHQIFVAACDELSVQRARSLKVERIGQNEAMALLGGRLLHS